LKDPKLLQEIIFKPLEQFLKILLLFLVEIFLHMKMRTKEWKNGWHKMV